MSAVRETNANAALARAVAMAEAAADALNEVPMDCLQGSGLGELLTRLRAVQRRIDASGALLGHRFAGCDEWDSDGAGSPVRWLFGQGNDTWGDARSVFSRGSTVADFPHLAEAWRLGEIGAQHVDALSRLARQFPRLVPDLSAADSAIAVVARACEPREFYQRLRQLCHRIDPDALDRNGDRRGIGLYVSTLLDGFVRVDGTLDPVLGARFLAALESCRRDVQEEPSGPAGEHSPLPDGHESDHRPQSERNLDALRRLLDAAGAATADLALPLVSGERPTVNVSVPIEALIDPGSAEAGWLERFGIPTTMITGAKARQLSCDASIRPLITTGEGQLIALFPRARTIHPALRRAVFLRDRRCRFPGCRSRIDEVHHIQFHSHGGPTVMANLIGLCWSHHHRVHEAGWRISGNPEGTVTFRSRLGRERPSEPAPPCAWPATRPPESQCDPPSPGVPSDPQIREGVIACSPIVLSSSAGASPAPVSCTT